MNKFIPFTSDISNITLPEKFNYPYNYTPHTLAIIAAKELKEYLHTQTDFNHDFGFNKTSVNKDALGKMFGVLVVKNIQNEIGYLTAFSGKLANQTVHRYFVPPVFNVLDKNGFYIKTEEEINQINYQIEVLEKDVTYVSLKKEYITSYNFHQKIFEEEHLRIKTRRKERKLQNKSDNQLNINEEFYLREYKIYLDQKIASLKESFETIQHKIDTLKQERKQKSAWVQQEIFKKYQFVNPLGETANLSTIFKNSTQNIPAGTGDCCAPKLLQYAFLHQLTPITMAEFWWGKPLTTSVRKHNYFYPACTGKCKPILTHMLQGLSMDENPLFTKLASAKKVDIVFEDEYLAVINKPNELLSVPGKEIEDSVYSRMKKKYPTATGPLIVHRLDMSTSGILLIAKNKEVHKQLQAQFINKTIQKRYTALLEGILTEKEGIINLPLRVDLNDRPKQLVCYEHGKNAMTKWERVGIENNKTRVHFYPITGRTHQLRVHAAHTKGLNMAILGDELYGKIGKRLYLHASSIRFSHPITSKTIEFTVNPPF